MEILIILVLIIGAGIWIYRATVEEKNAKKSFEAFEAKMNDTGYTRRIVVYDFLSETAKKQVHRWSVGIWLDYQKKMIVLLLERDNWNEIEIPFDKIQKVEIMEDEFSVTKTDLLGNRVSQISRGLKVIIVAGALNNGIKRHHLLLFDPKYNTAMKRSDENYKSIQECALSIADEIDNIIMENNKPEFVMGDKFEFNAQNFTIVNKSNIGTEGTGPEIKNK